MAGVDDAATAQTLKPLGCDLLQGLHFGQPLEAAAFVKAHRGD